MNFDFSAQEWMEHVRHFEQVMTTGATSASVESPRYFSRQYPNPLEADYKRRRFEAAMRFLDENVDSFDEGKMAVVGKRESGVSTTLYLTLYRFFAGPDVELDKSPPVDLVKAEYQKTKDYMTKQA